ncbi:hypothetical protein [Desulfurobacterium sp.]
MGEGFFDKITSALGKKCPKCGSTKIKINKSVAGKMCVCEECGHTWICSSPKKGNPLDFLDDIIKG